MGLVRALRIACASVSCASALVAGLVGRSARAAYTVQRVATGLSNPVYVTHAPGDASRLFIVESLSGYDTAPLAERVARIKILNLTGPNAGTVNAAPFLEIPNVTPQREDQGLFGLAFHPDYTQNGMFYVNYTVGYDGGMSHVVRYQVDLSNPNAANPASATPVYSYFKPYYNHSADWMGFNPVATGDARNFLYLTTGDGGANTDPQNRAQDPTLPYGKVLRFDVGSDGVKDKYPEDPARNYGVPADNPFQNVAGAGELVYDLGLRNPWRASFDRETGDLYIGNVGASTNNVSAEEVEVHRMNQPPGVNYGWSRKEGTNLGPNPNPPLIGDQLPTYQKIHDGGSQTEGPEISITGGYVYRGPIAELQGHYIFADYIGTNFSSSVPTAQRKSQIYSFIDDGSLPADFDGTNVTDFQNRTAQAGFQPNAGVMKYISGFGEDALGNLYIVDHGIISTPTSDPNNRNQGEIYRLINSGDFNADANIDGADFLLWQRNLGVGDLADWREHYGETFGPDGIAVPEPSTAVLALLCVWRRREVRTAVVRSTDRSLD
jgi:glucose/arabinose dehydrogenase